MNFETFASKGSIAQIYSSGLEYAFVSAEGKQCHPFVYCKDFLQDAIMAEVQKKKSAIYGFSHEYGNNPPVDLETLRLAVAMPEACKEFSTYMACSVNLINDVGAALGFDKVVGTELGTFSGKTVWVLVGEKSWMHAPPLISLLTCLVRVGATYKGDGWKEFLTSLKGKSPLGGNDQNYLSNISTKVWDSFSPTFVVTNFGEEMVANYPDLNISTMHNNTGIVAYCNKSYPASNFSHWKVPV